MIPFLRLGWWGTWCCWILNARTVESFGFGSSLTETVYFWIFIAVLVLFTIVLGPLGFIVAGMIGGFLFATRRALVRAKIRQRMGIYGSGVEDFCYHFCCTCCTVCQEAREVKFAKLPIRDYCSGELLVLEADSPGTGLPEDSYSGIQLLDANEESIMTALEKLSKTSRIILYLSATVVGITVLVLSITNPRNILVLALVFAQPLIVVYFVYWRKLRNYASFDYVIKLFAVGFWFATFQSIIIEMILQIILSILFGGAFSRQAESSVSTDDNTDSHKAASLYTSTINLIMGQYSSPHTAAVHGVIQATDPTTPNESATPNASPPPMVLYMTYMLLNAYVVAAGTEETMKNFIVRCCQFPGSMKHPYTVLIYLLAGALGFATSENITYVFGIRNAKGAESAMEEELLILFVRILMPVHLICSVLQACKLSTVLTQCTSCMNII